MRTRSILPLTSAASLALAVSCIAAEELRLTARELFEMATCADVTLSINADAIELERGMLYEDDGPAAGYCYVPNEERLAGGVMIKKVLLIDRPAASRAWLLVGPGGELRLSINGRPAELKPAGKAGQYWQKYEFDPALLIAGQNEFVLSGNGKVWIARDEDFAAGSRSRPHHANRSAKSTDGGKSWSDTRLGAAGDLDGEYYVRVFLEQQRPHGVLTLPLLDAANLAGSAIAPAVTSVGPIRIAATGSGEMVLSYRTGSTFVPGPNTWTAWRPLAGLTAEIGRPAGRYFQLRVDLAAADATKLPRLESIVIGTQPEALARWQERIRVVENHNAPIVRTSIPFEYEPLDHPRLKLLREQYKLDDVVRGAQTELELIGKLAVWSSQRWDKGHLGQQYPPWDAHEILEPHADGTPVGGFCQQYNVVFLQACESFGLVGRAVSIGPGDSELAAGKIRGGHEVVEIWSNQFAKWIYVDGNAAWYFVDDQSGVPLSLRELRQRQLDVLAPARNALRDVPATVKHVKLADSKYEWTGLAGWPPFLELRLIPRSNFLDQAAPLPLHQGMRGWFWTGHFVWNDDRAPASLLYGRRASQLRNWDWTLNQAHIALTGSESPGELHVELDTVTPGFETFLVTIDEQPAERSNASFLWKLHPGRNRLEAVPQNIVGREGVRSWIVMEYPGR